jgi:hypothetical protein
MNGGFGEICKNTARSAPNLPRFSASAKEAKAKGGIVPQFSNSWFQICCALHERLLFPPPGSIKSFAASEKSLLRAHAAKF